MRSVKNVYVLVDATTRPLQAQDKRYSYSYAYHHRVPGSKQRLVRALGRSFSIFYLFEICIRAPYMPGVLVIYPENQKTPLLGDQFKFSRRD